MVVLYVSLVIVLALVQVVLRWRVGRLEKRFVRVAVESDALVKQTTLRPGNNKPDPLALARQQFTLAQLAIKRDRVEARYVAAQSFSERFARFRKALSGYQGKVLPYLVGAVDVVTVVTVLDRFGIGVSQVLALLSINV